MLWGRSLYKTSHLAIIVVFDGLAALIFIDIIPQSFKTGQFWNGIIVITALFIYALIALTIFLVRLSRNRVWLHLIPRDYTISRHDTPLKMMDIIDNCSRDCRSRFADQCDNISVDHPGLQNPKKEQLLEIPYSSIAEIIPGVLEDSITAFHPRLTRKRSDSLRQYVYSAVSFGALSQEKHTVIEAFLARYEAVRFGRLLATEEQFYTLFESLLAVIRSIVIPDARKSRNSFALSGYSGAGSGSGDGDAISAVSEISDSPGITFTGSDSGSVIIRGGRGSFLYPQAPSSFADSSQLSLTDLVRHAHNASRRGSEVAFSAFGQDEPLSRTARKESYSSNFSQASNQTFVHHV